MQYESHEPCTYAHDCCTVTCLPYVLDENSDFSSTDLLGGGSLSSPNSTSNSRALLHRLTGTNITSSSSVGGGADSLLNLHNLGSLSEMEPGLFRSSLQLLGMDSFPTNGSTAGSALNRQVMRILFTACTYCGCS
jgi:hypothetical protein